MFKKDNGDAQLAKKGLHILSLDIEELVAQALANDSFMFLHASRENLEKGMLVWNQIALASGLHIN